MQPRETHAGHIIQETLHYWRQDIFPAMDMSVLHHIKSLQLQAPASQMPVFAPHSTEENKRIMIGVNKNRGDKTNVNFFFEG